VDFTLSGLPAGVIARGSLVPAYCGSMMIRLYLCDLVVEARLDACEFLRAGINADLITHQVKVGKFSSALVRATKPVAALQSYLLQQRSDQENPHVQANHGRSAGADIAPYVSVTRRGLRQTGPTSRARSNHRHD